jgi:hypothetical protein
MERLLEIIEDGGSKDHYQGEHETLHYWFHVDRFDRMEANSRLYDYAYGGNIFDWI